METIARPFAYIGIDPGFDGAVAVIDGDRITLLDTPTVTVRKREYLPGEMASILLPYAGRCHVVIEAVSGRPGQGSASARSIGLGMGLWVGICAAYGLPLEIVQPATWKRAFGLLGCEKPASRAAAQRLFPQALDHLKRVRDHGRAEALLLAEYGRQRKCGTDGGVW